MQSKSQWTWEAPIRYKEEKSYPAKAQMVEHDPEISMQDLHGGRYSDSGHGPEVFDLTALALYK